MYRLILVDDEPLILESVASAFEWEKYGFTLAGTFMSAERAIDYMEKVHVDAIISDIKMPGMDGIQFASYVYEQYPETIFVIISGFEKFEFAKKAIEYNVKEYLLKPISYDSMINSLKKIKGELDKRKDKLAIITDNTLMIQEEISNFLIKKVNNIALIQNIIKKFGFNCNLWHASVAYIRIEFINLKDFLSCHATYGREGLNSAINNFITFENVLMVLMNSCVDSNEYILFFDGNNVNLDMKFFMNLKKNIWDMLKLETNVYIKKVEKNIFDIVDYFEDEHEKSIRVYAENVFELALTGDGEKAIEVYRQIKSQDNINDGDIWLFWLLLSKKIRNIKGFDSLSKEFRIRVTQEITQSDNIESVIGEFAKESISILNYSPIEQAKSYIEEHYMERLVINDVAEFVYMSTSWFSKQFKSVVGMSFVNYVNFVRIEKSKELLKNTNLTVSEIYLKVGYNSGNHFYNLFKRHTGVSAHEFRKIHRNKH